MRSLARFLLILFAISAASLCALAQSAQKGGSGVVTGRITIGDKPVPGVPVAAASSDFGPDRREFARATADYEGNYRLTGLPAGRYNISPLSPTMVAPSDATYGGTGRSVIVGEGETVEKIDFQLTRTGVITGRITDAEGKPVIEERVQLSPADGSTGSRFRFGFQNPFMYQTDDRGVYRLYGVPPGRYILSIGVSSQDGMVRVGMVTRGYYQRTYYPGETDIKKATIIDVPEGGEVKDIDIKLGQRAQAFTVAGRVVEADTGRPVANVLIGYGSYNESRNRMMAFGFGQSRTDARGQFALEGIVPGSFAAFIWSDGDTYSDPVRFEVTDGDVSGLEIKVRRGASISGVAQIEGTSDRRVLARLSQLTLGASIQSSNLGLPENRTATINPDGSFRLTGLSPGKVSLFINGYPQPKDIRLVRVERDGAPQPGGIEVAPGAEITNVRVIFEYGSGSIRGAVRVENGELPTGTSMFIIVQKPGDTASARPVAYTQTDTRGRFQIEGLAAGDYQIVLRAQFPLIANRSPATVKQNATISNGMETEVTLTLDLEKTPEVKEP